MLCKYAFDFYFRASFVFIYSFVLHFYAQTKVKFSSYKLRNIHRKTKKNRVKIDLKNTSFVKLTIKICKNAKKTVQKSPEQIEFSKNCQKRLYFAIFFLLSPKASVFCLKSLSTAPKSLCLVAKSIFNLEKRA